MNDAVKKASAWPLVFCFALTGILSWAVARFVDLKPQVEEHFFFSAHDPLYQNDRKIASIFPQVPQIIIAAHGDLQSQAYRDNVEKLSAELESLPLILGLQSLRRGPEDLEDAKKGPLWKRTLLSLDHKASFILLFLKGNPDSAFIEKLEAITQRYSLPDFKLMISGVPYIVELVRRNLFQDLKVFSLAALAIFSISLLILFRSFWIVGGVLVACFNASAVTLLFARFLDLKTGFLTANLPTIVFVLTLSHIAFLTADWRQLMAGNGKYHPDLAWQAARRTFTAACWSTVTALLGFLTLFFVQAESLRQLGISGSIGTFTSFLAAYGIFPWFLMRQKKHPQFLTLIKDRTARTETFWLRPHRILFMVLWAVTFMGIAGLPKLRTDPSLFEYFKSNSLLRNGLEYIDANGGSNPLLVVIEDPDHEKLNDRDAYQKMWSLHLALEKDPGVGSVLSIPVMLAEAKRTLITKWMTFEWVLDLMESPRFGEVAKYFVTRKRDRALFILRMKEDSAERPRLKTVARIEQIVRKNDYIPVLMGGVFLLQGRLSQLISSSLISGSTLLNLVILIITWFLTRSWRTSIAMLISLYFVPAVMLGLLGWMKIPLDVIAAPAANVAIGMGVDSMIHLASHAKASGVPLDRKEAWAKANAQLWDPIFLSTLMVASGFSIFLLSSFPPTQRFGFSVVLGTVLSPFATLCVLPAIAAFSLKGIFQKNPSREHS